MKKYSMKNIFKKFASSKKKNIFKKFASSKKKNMIVSFSVVILIYGVVEALIKTHNLSFLLTSLLVPTVCYVIVALALNLVVGYSGDLSLGHAAFMCVGAFAGVSISNYFCMGISSDIVKVIVAIISGSICSGIFGYFVSIPVFKLTGDYLAIVTLAFCQIVKTLVNIIYFGYDSKGVHFSLVKPGFELEAGGKMFINGPVGSTGNDKLSNFTMAIILLLVVLIIIYNLIHSKYGRAIMASRDNRIAAGSVGLNVTKIKTLCFVISSIIAGAGGAMYALNYTTLSPAKFDFNLSILVLVYVVLGGLGNITGTIIATSILVLLPEMLRSLADLRMVIYALVLIAMMLIKNNDNLKVMSKQILDKLFRKKENGDVR